MDTLHYKSIYQNYIEEMWHQKNLGAASVTSPQLCRPGGAAGCRPPGIEGAKFIIGFFLNAFPDVRIQLDDINGENGQVGGPLVLAWHAPG